jgi:hypothetical protein
MNIFKEHNWAALSQIPKTHTSVIATGKQGSWAQGTYIVRGRLWLMESHYRCVDVLLVNQANNPDVIVTAYTSYIFPTELTKPINYALMPSIDSDYEFSSLQRIVEVDYLVLTGCKKVLGGMK